MMHTAFLSHAVTTNGFRNLLVSRLSALASLVLAAATLHFPVQAQAQTQQVTLSASYTQLGRLAPDVSQTTLAFNIDAGARTVIVDIASVANNLLTSVQLPNGVVVNPQTASAAGGVFLQADGNLPQGPLLFPFSSGGVHYVYRLPVTTAGTLIVRVSTPTVLAEQAAVVAQMISDSPVATQVQFTEPSGVVGRPVVLAALIFDGANAVHGAAVQARVLSATGIAETLTLRDDGQAGDGAAGDGLYSALFTPVAPGVYRAAVEFSGAASVGTFLRQGAAVLEVLPASGTLAGTARGRGIDLNSNGALDRVAVDVDMQAVLAGTYRAVVQLSAAGKKMMRSGDVSVAPGATVATASFDTQELLTQGLGRGPYNVDFADLAFVDASGRVQPADRKLSLGQIDLSASSFERPPVRLTGVSSDQGVDTDANGRFDWLLVNLQVDVQEGGQYVPSARLTDGRGNLIAVSDIFSFAVLSPGIGSLPLRFNGRDIASRGINGPFTVEGLLIASEVSAGLVQIGAVALTGAYAYTQFDGSLRNAADVDGNGLVNCADLSIVRASIGKRAGEPGFDARADVNLDAMVDARDLGAVARAMPVGSSCP